MENDKNEVSVQIKTQAEDTNQSVTKLISNLSSLNSNIEKISNSLDKIDSSSKKASNSVKGTKDALNQMSSISSKLQSSFNTMFNVGKFYLVWNVTKRIRDSMISLINSSIDYIETQNLFDVSMNNQSAKAYKFMNTMANTFGIARTELMNYQASFNNVMKSLPGLSDETAYALSETLMKMSVDYASLFNFTLPKAMEKFQAAVVGSVKPIRDKTGMDITEKTIQQVAKNIGVEKTVGQLNQVEKRLLRIISLQSQLNEVGAIGDFAKTIESPSNQLKVLQQQLQELGVWLGNVFIGTIGKILPYINGFVMALVAMAKALAIFVGYSETKYDDPLQVEDTTNSVTGLNNSLDNATSSAKKLKKVLMGFDVLNVITTPTTSDSTSSSTSVDPKIIAALQEYDNLMSNVHMKAIDVRDTIMEWLGFEKEINSETGEITWKLKDGHTNLMKIKDGLILLGTTIVSISIIKKVINLINFLKQMSTLLSNLSKIKIASKLGSDFVTVATKVGIVVAAIITLIAMLKNVYERNEVFRKSVDNLAPTLKKVLDVITKLISFTLPNLKELKLILEPILRLIEDIVGFNWFMALNGIETLINTLEKLFKGDLQGAAAELGKGISNMVDYWGISFNNFGKYFSDSWFPSFKSVLTGVENKTEETSDSIIGTVSLTSSQIQKIGENISSSYQAQSETFQNYKSNLDSLSQSINSSIESLNNIGISYSLLGTQISETDSKKIFDSISTLANDSTQLVDESTSQQLSIISNTFNKTNTLTKDEQEKILKTIATSGNDKKNKIKSIEKDVTTVYEKAIKTRGYLTDDEYEYISKQLKKIRQLTNTQMKLSAGEQLALKSKINDQSAKLDADSYQKIAEQLKQSQSNTLALIEQNNNEKYAYALQAAQDAYDLAIENGKSIADAEIEKNNTLKGITESYQQEYRQDVESANAEYERLRKQFTDRLFSDWSELEQKGEKNLTDSERKAKETYESLLKEFGVTEGELLRRSTDLGFNSANNVQKGFNDKKPYLSISVATPNGYNVGKNLATGISKGFNDWKQNIKFTQKSLTANNYFYGWSHYATGGLPDIGEMFVAREAGPELVGRIGNRTAVMNNQQIVESVSRGVAQAVSSVMGQQGGSYHLYIDGQELTDVVTRRQNRNKSVMGV